MHDDGAQPGIPQEDDVLGEGGLEVVVDHGVAAVLDDDERAAEPLEPGQRLDERRGLGLGDAQRGGVDRAAQGLVGGVIGRSVRGSGGVGGVLVDVVVGEVVGPDRRGRVARVQVDDDVHLAAR